MPFKILLFLSITLLAACTAQPSTASPANATLSITEAHAPGFTIAPTLAPTETPTPEVTPTETFAPMELSADLEHPGKCTYDDVRSGRLAWNVKQNAKPFPPEAINRGWKNVPPYHILLDGTKSALQLVSICKINDDFEGFTDNRFSFVTSFAVKNPDGSTGAINFFEVNNAYMHGLLNTYNNEGEFNNLGIITDLNHDQVTQHWDDQYGPMFRLYSTEGLNAILAVNSMTGNVPQEVEKFLYIWAKASS